MNGLCKDIQLILLALYLFIFLFFFFCCCFCLHKVYSLFVRFFSPRNTIKDRSNRNHEIEIEWTEDKSKNRISQWQTAFLSLVTKTRKKNEYGRYTFIFAMNHVNRIEMTEIEAYFDKVPQYYRIAISSNSFLLFHFLVLLEKKEFRWQQKSIRRSWESHWMSF